MIMDIPQRYVRRLTSMTPAQQRAWIKKCSPRDLLTMDAAFEAWAEAGQIAPSAEGWRVWLMMAGRGYGKTRAGAEWIHSLAMMGDKRIALVGATIDEARSIMVEGVSGLLGIARRKRIKIKWEPGMKRLTWPRGSVAELFSGESPEGLRGPEHDYAWCTLNDRSFDQWLYRGYSDHGATDNPVASHGIPHRVIGSHGSFRRPRGFACRL